MPLKSMLHPIISLAGRRRKLFFLILTVMAGMFILWPLHDFQHYLSQGDHGRDLYCFKKTMEGAVPYRDYSWLFGPLMPYYYSLCGHIGGLSIQTVLLGQGLLILSAGILIYLSCAVFLPPSMSFLCALWYWNFRGAEFFYTYNHIGGLLALLVVFYSMLRYIRTNRPVFVYAGFTGVLVLMMVRLNMGVAILAAFIGSLIFSDYVHRQTQASRQWRRYFLLALAVLAGASLIYWALLHSLPDYGVYQSFPYGKSQRTDYTLSILQSSVYIGRLILTYFKATASQAILGMLFVLSAIQSARLIFGRKLPQPLRSDILAAFGSLVLFILLGMHEFAASGVLYRVYWIFPLVLMAVFFLMGIAVFNFSSRTLRFLIFLTLFLPVFLNVRNEQRMINSFKRPEHMLHIGKNKVYTVQDPAWFTTVRETVDFIKENVGPDEKLLVLPFDPLYLFLAEKNSPTRQLVFFEHIHIHENQEREIIAGLGNWALISNRSVSHDPGLGTFGEDYCPLLAQYLQDYFTPVFQFGNWESPPGWAWNHGVKILKRSSRQ